MAIYRNEVPRITKSAKRVARGPSKRYMSKIHSIKEVKKENEAIKKYHCPETIAKPRSLKLWVKIVKIAMNEYMGIRVKRFL
jgi:hypothetical protein